MDVDFPTAVLSSSSSRDAGGSEAKVVQRLVGHSAEGHPIHLLECKHGYTRYEVWLKQGVETVVLGKISILSFPSKTVYKATCQRHKQCSCVINSLSETELIQWLSVAADKSPVEHEELSREVRQSLGMRIRKK